MNSMLFPSAERYPLVDRPPQLFRLKTEPGGHPLWMWRDDPDGFAFGGNKVRFYECLLPVILSEKPDVIVTSGSPYSNHIRVTAEVCSRLGIGCRLLITADPPAEGLPSGVNNLTIAASLGAVIEYIGSFAAMLRIAEYSRALSESGLKVYTVPNAGHTPQAASAFADVIASALMTLDGYGVAPERVFIPCASGTSMTGLLAGSAVLSAAGVSAPKITGIAVGNTPAGCRKGIGRLLRAASAILPGCPDSADADVSDGGCAYGDATPEQLALRSTVIESEGVILDRTYNTPAFFGALKALEESPGDSPALYINTGGFPG